MQDAAILRFIDRLIRSWFFCVSGQCKENRIGARQKFIQKRSVIQSPIAISASPIKLRWDCFGCWEGPIIRICSIRGIFSENPIGKSVLHREGLNVGPSFNHDGSHKVHPFLDLCGPCLSTRAMEKQKAIYLSKMCVCFFVCNPRLGSFFFRNRKKKPKEQRFAWTMKAAAE